MRRFLLIGLLLCTACPESSDESPDSGTNAESDSGLSDSGVSDSGIADSGTNTSTQADAGPADSGVVADSGVPADAGTPDAGTGDCVTPVPVRKIVMGSDSVTSVIRTLDTDGSNDVTFGPDRANELSISGDGTAVFYISDDGLSSNDIFRIASSGAGLATVVSSYALDVAPPVGTDLESTTVNDHRPHSNSDGSVIRWITGEDDYGAMLGSTSGGELLTDLNLVDPFGITMAPNGTTALAYWSCTGNFTSWFTCDPRSDRRVGIASGGSVSQLGEADQLSQIALSPDGSHVSWVESAGIGMQNRVMIAPSGGGTALDLTGLAPANEEFMWPQVSDDRVVYVRDGATTASIESVKRDGSGDLQTHYTTSKSLRIALSSDGTALVVLEQVLAGQGGANILAGAFPECEPTVVVSGTSRGWYGELDVQ